MPAHRPPEDIQMDARSRWLEKMRDKLITMNDKAGERAAELTIALSEKAEEEDAKSFVKAALEIVEFLPSLVIFATNVSIDPRVPIGDKIKIAAIIALLVSPADIILMELIGPLALMDDAVLIAYLIFSICTLVGKLDEQVLTDNWVGKPEHIKTLAEAARAITGLNPNPAQGII